MSKLDRKIKRQAKKRRKKQAQKDMTEKIGLFNLKPEACQVCGEPFDKKNREMVRTWNVVVRREQEKVNLYCPKCWAAALDKIKQIKERLNEHNKG